MNVRAILVILGAATLASTVSMTAPAQAQATRTWVSGVGDDANPCSRTAPCKTFAGAISKTAPGGLIDCLDPGGFGAVTITKSIGIWCEETGVASVLVAGTNGIIINAGATDVVTLQGLNLEGLLGSGNANAGLSGIRVLSAGEVHIDKVKINGFFNWGIDWEPSNGSAKLTVNDTVIDNVGNANAFSGGILLQPGNATIAKVSMTRVTVGNVFTGIDANAGTGGSLSVSIRDSLVHASVNSGIVAETAGAVSQMMISHTTSSNNGTNGIRTNGAAATLFIGDSVVTGNGTGLNNSAGTLFSYKTNQVDMNNTNTSGTISTQTPE
jgi:hypothetical protein